MPGTKPISEEERAFFDTFGPNRAPGLLLDDMTLRQLATMDSVTEERLIEMFRRARLSKSRPRARNGIFRPAKSE